MTSRFECRILARMAGEGKPGTGQVTGMEPRVEIVQFDDAGAFFERVHGHLMADEANNNLILGLVASLRDHAARFDVAPYMASVEERGQVIGAALRTSLTRPLAMSALADEAVALVLANQEPPLTAAVGPEATVRAFTTAWCARTGASWTTRVQASIYRLTRVHAPADVPGNLRVASEDDVPLLLRWLMEFSREALGEDLREDQELPLRRRARDGHSFIWELDGEPVSSAGVFRRTPNGAVVSGVYTPPPLRRHGYASACVAAVSQRYLDAGYDFCALYADRTNPTSNAIYQRMGYETVGESLEVGFNAP